jgi:hypothetical protein
VPAVERGKRVSLSLPPPTHMPCPECGGSVARGQEVGHRCDPERRLDYMMFQLQSEVDGFDRALGDYFSSPQGRFEQWDAERRRLYPGTP